jgi:protein involved in polysaccharide export with SLBB domain
MLATRTADTDVAHSPKALPVRVMAASSLRRRTARVLALAGLAGPAAVLSGCGLEEHNTFMDRSVMGRWEFTPTSVPILERLAAIEGTTGPGNVETSPVRPEDLIPEVEAYRLGAGDELEIRVQDFLTLDREEVFPRQIDPRGFLDLPLLGSLYVDGLAVDDIRAVVAKAIVDKGLLKDPIVSVQVLNRRRLTFSVIGAVNSPGLYAIPRPDYRLLDALTAAGRFSESVQYVYVIRQIPLSEKITRGSVPRAPGATAPTLPPSSTTPGTTPAKPATPAAPRENVLDLIDELTKPAAPAPATPDAPKPATPEPGKPAPGLAVFAAQPSNPSSNPPPVDLPQERSTAGSKTLQPVVPDRPAPKPAPTAQPAPAQPAPAQPAPAQPVAAPATTAPAASSPTQALSEEFWIYKDGQWIPVRSATPTAAPAPSASVPPVPTAAPTPTTPPTPAGTPVPSGGQPALEPISVPPLNPPVPAPIEPAVPTAPATPPAPLTIPGAAPVPTVEGAETLVTQRVIEVPVGPLLAGSAQFNIIIRPGDVIRVPSPAEGLVYISGEVQRPGPYNLPTAGRLTLLRGIVAAGGLGPLAVPERVDLIRMVGPDRQAWLRLNLRAIAEGTQPDIYLRSDDMVSVGSDFWAFPLTVIRNGFRASYGFGFILDRNFQGDVFGPDQATQRF